MKVLENTIISLDPEEYKQLFSFIKHKPSKRKRKDLLLLELIHKNGETTDQRIEVTLELKAKSNAYHALRKRLLKLIMHFIYLRRVDIDSTASAEVMHLLSFADFQFERNNTEQAQRTLAKAEVLAKENELFSLLTHIFEKQLEHQTFNTQELEDFATKKDSFSSLKDEQDRASLAFLYLKCQIEDARTNKRLVPFQLLLDHTLRKYNLENAVIQRPKMLYQVIESVRSNLLSKKEFYEFEKYLTSITNEYFSIINFNKKDHIYFLKITYITAHTMYRNRKFKEGLEYSQRLNQGIEKYEKQYYRTFFAKQKLLHAALLFYTNHSTEAINILQDCKTNHWDLFSLKEQNYLTLNLAFYNYANQSLDEALKIAQELHHTDGWYEKKISGEWALKRSIMEALIQIDLGNEEIGLSRINTILQRHKELFKLDVFKRVGYFLKFIKRILMEVDFINSEEFDDLINNKLVTLPEEKEDLQAMSFYVWLKARKTKQTYYQTLLDTTKREEVSFY
jgi:hypothetical protein